MPVSNANPKYTITRRVMFFMGVLPRMVKKFRKSVLLKVCPIGTIVTFKSILSGWRIKYGVFHSQARVKSR
jgi:hypothetical protein